MLKTNLKLEEIRLPKINEYKSALEYSNNMFDWGLSKEYENELRKTYGFVYKCLADNTSNPGEWLDLAPAVGRNAIKAILYCHDSHLLSGILTFYYPENGLSPDTQAKFVSMVCNHPQAKDITELRIVTRSAWFLSDSKCSRVLKVEDAPSDQKDTEFYRPPVKENNYKKRLKILRKDPYFDKSKKVIFFNFAKMDDDAFGIYLGEDEYFVYWAYPGEGKIYRTDHTYVWHNLNAIVLSDKMDKELYNKIKDEEFNAKNTREILKQFNN